MKYETSDNLGTTDLYDHVCHMPSLNVAKAVIHQNLEDKIACNGENGTIHFYSLPGKLESKILELEETLENFAYVFYIFKKP